MRDKKARRVNFKYDGEFFVYINPDFIKEEKEKIEGMSTEKAVDYILFESDWSIAFRDTGWKKTRDGHTATYRRERHETYYSRCFENTSEETETRTLKIEPGKTPVYTRSVTGTLTYDDGRKEREEPILEKDYGDEAINIMTGGLWRTIMEEGRENEKKQRKN